MSTNEMSHLFTRRSFLRWSQSAMAALGGFPLLSRAAEAPASAPIPDYYDKLGVPKIINAAGTYTGLTAACMPPEVVDAVQKAALHPVRLHDLQQRAGEYIAQKLKCEGAVVTSGASGAITLATSACILDANPGIKPVDIPQNLAGRKNKVIVQKSHRYGYDHAIFLCGAEIVEVVTMDDYKKACAAGNAVMTNYFNAAEDEETIAATQIGREDWIRVAHEHGIPCHNDAAADMPPVSNLWKYTGMGFDLVSFSGGKGIRGPQNAGLLLGKKKLTDLAHASNNPGEGVGRGMKVAKEQIVGMVAAVDYLLKQSDESLFAEYNRRCKVIADALKSLSYVKTSVSVPKVANHVPHLIVKLDPAAAVTVPGVVKKLRAENPPIELNPNTGRKSTQGLPSDENTIVIGVWMLQPGEEQVVARRLYAALGK